MPRSKEKYPERNGERWSYCYQDDPMRCSTHFHVTAIQLAKLLDARKAVVKGDEEVASTGVEELMNSVFVEETEEEYAARKFKYPNEISEVDGNARLKVSSPDLTGTVEEIHYKLSTGKKNLKTGVITWDEKIVFEAKVHNDSPKEGDYFSEFITKNFDNYREASEWANDQVQYLQAVKDMYPAMYDLVCKEEGCTHRGGGPSHFNYKESGSYCHYYPTPSPHCTCRACWG